MSLNENSDRNALEKYLRYLKEFGNNEVRLLIDRIEKIGSIQLTSQNLSQVSNQKNKKMNVNEHE